MTEELQDFIFRKDEQSLSIEAIGELAFAKPNSEESSAKHPSGELGQRTRLELNLANLCPVEFSRDHTRKIHALNLVRARELESRRPPTKKKTHLAFQTFDVRDPRFAPPEQENQLNRKPGDLGKFGEMGSFDFEDEEKSIEKHTMQARERRSRTQLRKGESFCIRREDFGALSGGRKLSMRLGSRPAEGGSFEGDLTRRLQLSQAPQKGNACRRGRVFLILRANSEARKHGFAFAVEDQFGGRVVGRAQSEAQKARAARKGTGNANRAADQRKAGLAQEIAFAAAFGERTARELELHFEGAV